MAKKVSESLAVIACPDLLTYPKAPEDMSHCEVAKCPRCKGDMWLSDKKQGMVTLAKAVNQDILLACYRCIIKFAHKNPDFFKNADVVNM